MTTEEYLIGELADKTGVSVRTIRFYISEGLLPSPGTKGRYTVYDEDYIHRIDLIKRLKEAFLPIKEIRVMLETKSEAEINEFLTHYETTGVSNDALDYISNIMETKKNRYPQPFSAQIQSPQQAMPSDRKLMPAVRTPRENRDGSRWRRFEIIPGLELHVDELVLNRSRQIIYQLIEDARKSL